MATWGTLKVLNPTKNKMSMELSVILFYPDDPDRKGRQDGIQFGNFEEKNVSSAPAPIYSTPSGKSHSP